MQQKYSLHKFEQGLKELKIELSDTQIQQFITFYELLVEKNKVMNLTGITEWEEVVQKHFLDSLSIVKCLNVEEMQSMIDVGTGAGFPGIPLKIAFPHLNVTLMDSLNKRIRFLDEVIEACALDSIQAVHSRAEDLARDAQHRENYDLCVSRAVANLSTLSEYCLPFVKTGGIFVSYKAQDIEEEQKNADKAIAILGGAVKELKSFCLPDSDIGRTLVVIDKKKPCSKRFPRKAGMAKNQPL